MIFLAISDTMHVRFDLFAERETKSFLLAQLKSLPIQSGCYVYFGVEKTILYVGKSDALHSRLTHHATAKRGFEKQNPDWQAIGILFSDNPLLTEKELIRQLNPITNRQ